MENSISNTRRFRLYLGLAVATYTVILTTLFLGVPLAELTREQDVQAVFFLAGMLFVGLSIFFHWLPERAGWRTYLILLGLLGLLVMLFLRAGMAERSHLIEYGLLSIFIHRAWISRFPMRANWKNALSAIGLVFLLGAIDELLQLVIPGRHFDPVDIAFNFMASLPAVLGHFLMSLLRSRGNNASDTDH